MAPTTTTPRLRSGLWHGHYIQYWLRSAQQMNLEFADGIVRGDGGDPAGKFVVEEDYRQAGGQLRIGFIKTYPGAHSVLYLGHLLGDELRGQWSIPPWDKGAFALHFDPNSTPGRR